MIAVDTNVVIAALLSWHEFHERAAAILDQQMREGSLILPQPVLLESYSVMTRFPSPHRLRPEIARELLFESFRDVRLVALPARKSWDLLETCVSMGLAGGRIYDAAIAFTAIEAGAANLFTFNAADFEPFADRIGIVVP